MRLVFLQGVAILQKYVENQESGYTMGYTIRKATNTDQEALLALGRKIVNVYERTHLGDKLADDYLKSGACDRDLVATYGNATVVLDGDLLIGFMYTEKNEIQGLSVDIPYWGKGVAQKLIAYASRNLCKEYSEIQLECFVTSPRANRFYQKMGFQNCGIVEGEGGCRVLYKRKINGNLSPKETLLNWVDVFNIANAKELSEFYAEEAINHQVVTDPVVGKSAIYRRFVEEFSTVEMVCILENIFMDGEWAMMEWKDPKGFRGCGFFHMMEGKIVFQRGYMDKMSFLTMNGLPIE